MAYLVVSALSETGTAMIAQLAGSVVARTGRLDGALHYFHVSAGIFPVLADRADGAEGETDMDLSYGYQDIS